MANGIMKSQADYYDDSSTYTGDAGSASNKYVIEDFYDLGGVSNVNTDSITSVFFEIVNDIDLNDYDEYKHGVSEVITQCNLKYHIDGKNHKIRNLIVNSPMGSIFISHGTGYNNANVGCFDNIIFENLVLINSDYPVFNVALNNCHFGMYCFNSTLFLGSNSYRGIDFTDCSFNIKGLLSNAVIFGEYSVITRCHLNFDINISCDCIFLGGTSAPLVDNSYITGVVRHIETGTSNPFLIDGLTFNNSYIAVSVTPPQEEVENYSINSLNVEGVSFVDKDLIPNLIEYNMENFYCLNTSQATDPYHLLSIGFPVAPTAKASVADPDEIPDGLHNAILIADDTTGTVYQFGINNGTTYFNEVH